MDLRYIEYTNNENKKLTGKELAFKMIGEGKVPPRVAKVDKILGTGKPHKPHQAYEMVRKLAIELECELLLQNEV
tara:strand:+ start:1349 stop:1573 length:225 start_codon:yes stop_codon:yes gene_type:complete